MKTIEPALSWYDVPPDLKQLLISAARSWEDTTESESYMYRALEKGELNLDVLIAAYRYFFYKNNNSMALNIAQKVMKKVEKNEGYPDDWERLKPILEVDRDNPCVRLYLNAYSASGFVLARLGETDKAQEIATRIKEIDDKNEFGASIVLDILTRPEDDDD
jgi:tetratricopeptide (TPR) repeat protein